ncbi:hemolysin [Acinetobacter sp. NCu2D-2]|uniref:I78 family peptidase inhibitor n=1 Tax=Acinetobacter sp. NCu2D-2 TaxID=1608473 RepID=UPI0007CDC346|nr:I78 family peptidase inhibitor [Acinetobacter sp. NCu2D-2]ANF83118.1 hemolysin [Acinetobacter sp. NCu2D-2]
MKKIFAFAALASLMTACTTSQETTSTPPKIGMANPASQYCVEQGGKLEIRNEADGQVGYCHLANGQVIEEWALFRANQAECVPEEAKRLIGQSHLTEAQIKKLTKAQTVRMVAPGQPVTMDYRAERVTVTVDPSNNKIVQASCG